MIEIPKTFCPAKWDEIMINFSYNYVFACCKATPIKYDNNDLSSVLDKQKENLLNGIQDPSCNYCWKVENNNLSSRRHEYLKFFDKSKFEQYKEKTVLPSVVELYIGNECNFQCTYCNSKYSSQWELDVKRKTYKIFTDRHFYGIDEKNYQVTDQILDVVKNLNGVSRVNILGGEPLHNKLFWQIIESVQVTNFFVSTNLSCNKKEIDKIFNYSDKFENIYINVSIDSTEQNAEFTRYGMNFLKFEDNLNYLLGNAPANIHVSINSVLSSITIRDLNNFIIFIKDKKKKFEKLTWSVCPCIYPRIQSFDTLADEYKDEALKLINEVKLLDYAHGVETVESALLSSKFNKSLYQELKHFLTEFAERKKIKVPICLN